MYGDNIRGSGHICYEFVQQRCVMLLYVVDFGVKSEELQRGAVRCETGAAASTLRSVFLAYHQETLEHIGNSPGILLIFLR